MSDGTPDFKATLNLPTTEFPMKGNLNVLEPKMLECWSRENIFSSVLEANASKPSFTLHDGPPYANGHLHAGHALNKILKDLVVKFRNLSGFRADFVPGWDCHGLPIEQAVERELREKKIDKKTLSAEAFLQACRDYALEYVKIQTEEFRRMGVFADYASPYLTLSFDYEAQEIRELAKIAEAGALYRKKRPVFWCVYDQTALALAEVEYEDIAVPSVYVAFPATDSVTSRFEALRGKTVHFVIWTTTPWTLPANLAICVNPALEYVFYQLGDTVICVAKELLTSVLAVCAPDELREKTVSAQATTFEVSALVDPTRILTYASGEMLEGLQYSHPFLPRTSPVALGKHVTLEAGTGLVHTAPGHGPDDYEVGLKYGLDIYNPVKNNGRYDDTVGESLKDMFIFDANTAIPKVLAEKKLLLNPLGQTQVTSYPHSWRSRKPIIYRATPQWFISLETTSLRKKALDAIENQVKWVPAWGHDRIHGMLSTRPDWTISRQRTWGVPIPTALCDECGHSVASPELMRKVADVVEREGAGAWLSRPLSEFYEGGDTCPSCKKQSLKKDRDILDVWFDSACSFASVMEKRGRHTGPVDLYLEGSDQHRGWFHSSLLVSMQTRGVAPYKTCLTHGFVVDGNGEKFSKSKKNGVAPDDIIKRYGAEIMRLWVASADYRDDVRLSFAILDGLSEGYRRIRNTIRYALSNLYDFDPERDSVKFDDLMLLDQWALVQLRALMSKLKNAYETYEFHTVYHASVDFCSSTLSAMYFDAQKDTLYTGKKNGAKRRSAQTALYQIASELIVALAPILSFTSEEAYQFLPGEKKASVFLAAFPVETTVSAEQRARLEPVERIFKVREQVLPILEVARREKRIGKSEDARLQCVVSSKQSEALKPWHTLMREALKVSQIEWVDDVNSTAGLDAPLIDVKVLEAKGLKCPRCWTFNEELQSAHELCHRCQEAVS
jgi:isoleucyl-tRNA synthetase